MLRSRLLNWIAVVRRILSVHKTEERKVDRPAFQSPDPPRKLVLDSNTTHRRSGSLVDVDEYKQRLGVDWESPSTRKDEGAEGDCDVAHQIIIRSNGDLAANQSEAVCGTHFFLTWPDLKWNTSPPPP